jgi:hypothetical protein
MPRMLGYGLARMGEGISGGLLRGTMYNNQMEAQKQEEANKLALEIAKMTEQARQHAETVGVQREGQATTAQSAKDRLELEKQKFNFSKIGTALDSASKVLEFTEDGEAATKVLQSFWGKDEQSPITGIKLIPKTKQIQIDAGNGTWLLKDKSVLDDLAMILKDHPDSGQEAIQEAAKAGIATFIPKKGAPMSEADKAKLPLEERRVKAAEKTAGAAAERANIAKETAAGKPAGWKDQKIAELWPNLSDDEKKRVIGARLDPHDLTEKNILDVYGNIMTDPSVRKALQPIAEKIVSKAANKGKETETPTPMNVSKSTPPDFKPEQPGFATFKGEKTKWYWDGNSWKWME